MPLPSIKISYTDTIYSPFSGLPAEDDSGTNRNDPTLLFAYYGDASVWGYISPSLAEALGTSEDEIELKPADLEAGLEIEGGVIIRVDNDWNGVNTYGYAPAGSTIRFASED